MRYARFLAISFIVGTAPRSAPAQLSDSVTVVLRRHETNLLNGGADSLVAEAGRSHFFMLGELHGENEIPALMRRLWPSMWQAGYRHLVVEASPLAARALEAGGSQVGGLWTQAEADFVTSFKRGDAPVLWAADIEENRPQRLVAELAAANPTNAALRVMRELLANGYRRDAAPQLLALARQASDLKDVTVNGASLYDNLLNTLQVEADRMSSATRLRASERREHVMKMLFLAQFEGVAAHTSNSRIMLRLGGNHLNRGYDRRGVSTLGNFVAELAVARRLRAFNVMTFAAGGQIWWGGALRDADQTGDDPALAFLATIARYDASLFDLRPLRQLLHRSPATAQSPALASLMYWADAYDMIICYKRVTPLRAP